jgi:hypothetical protein
LKIENCLRMQIPTPSLQIAVIELVEMSGMWRPTQRVSAEANLFDYAEPQGGRRSQSRTRLPLLS